VLVRTGRRLGELGGCHCRDRFTQTVRSELAGQPAVYLANELHPPLADPAPDAAAQHIRVARAVRLVLGGRVSASRDLEMH
jgi:hypothetical protein